MLHDFFFPYRLVYSFPQRLVHPTVSSPSVVFGTGMKTSGGPYSSLSGSLSFGVDLATPEPDFIESLEPVDKGNQFPVCSLPCVPPSVLGTGSSGLPCPPAGGGSCWPFDGGGS
jgi:hypothetical protein